jgi:adenylate kinase
MRGRQRATKSGGAIVLLGLPGSGKGTQALKLADAFGVPTLSTGEMLRYEVQSGTPLGIKVRDLIAQGLLVSDQLVNQVVRSRLLRPDCENGFVLDGYPRTVAQARFLDECLAKRGFAAPLVVFFDITASEVAVRLTSRLACPRCGRTYTAREERCAVDGTPLIHRMDDNAETIAERFRQYEINTEPLLSYYARNLRRISAVGTPQAVFDRVTDAIGGALKLTGNLAAAARSRMVAAAAVR